MPAPQDYTTVASTFHDMVSSGKVRALGISNHYTYQYEPLRDGTSTEALLTLGPLLTSPRIRR